MASYLRKIAGSSSSDANSNDLGKRLAKWALIIGVPTAVCVAAYLVYRHQQQEAKKSLSRQSSLPTPLTATSGDTAATTDNRSKVIMKFDFNLILWIFRVA
jgi:hypothetical protein